MVAKKPPLQVATINDTQCNKNSY